MIKKQFLKRSLVFSLATIMLVSCVTGCGNNSDKEKDKDNTEQKPTVTQGVSDDNYVDDNTDTEDTEDENDDMSSLNPLFDEYSLEEDYMDYQGEIKDADGSTILTNDNELIYYNNSTGNAEKQFDVNKNVIAFSDYWGLFNNADGSMTCYFESYDGNLYEGIIPADFVYSDIVNIDLEEFMPFIYTMSSDGTVSLYNFDTNDDGSTMEFENYDDTYIIGHKETVWAFHDDPDYGASHKSVEKTMTFTPFENRGFAKDDSGRLYLIYGEHDGDFEFKEIALTDMPDMIFYSVYGWVTIYGLESTPDRIYVDETKDSEVTLHQEIMLPEGYTIDDIVSASTYDMYRNMLVSFKDGTYAVAGNTETNSESYSDLVISDFLTSVNTDERTAKLIVRCNGQDSYLLDTNGYYYDIGYEVRKEYSK